MPDPLPLVVSIQSQVAFGHVGNSAAALPMRACGVEVVEVPTTLLSNHPRYPTMPAACSSPELVADLLAGLVERGVHARAAVILSGFLGRDGTAAAVADFVASRAVGEPGRRLYACDPVMGDADIGFFAGEALRAAFASTLVPLPDLILPNAFELAALAAGPGGGARGCRGRAAGARRSGGGGDVGARPRAAGPARDRHRDGRRADDRRGSAPLRASGRDRRPPLRARRGTPRARGATVRRRSPAQSPGSVRRWR